MVVVVAAKLVGIVMLPLCCCYRGTRRTGLQLAHHNRHSLIELNQTIIFLPSNCRLVEKTIKAALKDIT